MIIGLSGYARAGKDTAAAFLVEQHGFVRLAHADALKAVYEDINPWIRFSDGGYRKLDVVLKTLGWEIAKAEPEIREGLQDVGMACREHLGPDVWVDAVMRQIEPGTDYVIPGCRFPNEVEAIKAAGGLIWRVERILCGPVNGHVSETALDDWPFDAHIPNHSTVAALGDQVSLHLEAARA